MHKGSWVIVSGMCLAFLSLSHGAGTPEVKPDDTVLIEGYVHTADGKVIHPLDGGAWFWNETGRYSNEGFLGTDFFQFEQIKTGTKGRVIIDVAGYALWISPEIVVGKKTTSFNIILKPAPVVTVSGRLIDSETKEPLSGAPIVITKFTEGGLNWCWSIERRGNYLASTDKEGHFQAALFRPGDQFNLTAYVTTPTSSSWVSPETDPSHAFQDPKLKSSPTDVKIVVGTASIQLQEASFHRPTFIPPPMPKGPPYFDEQRKHPFPGLLIGPEPISQTPSSSILKTMAHMLLNWHDHKIYIEADFDGPAAAGLLVSDELVQVDGKDVHTLMEADRALNGEVGSTVKVSVRRIWTKDLLTFDLVRGKITQPPVRPWEDPVVQSAAENALDKIRLPENPTREQVKTYILEMQRSDIGPFPSSILEKMTDMYCAVGSENIDLLLEVAPALSWTRYRVLTAVNELVREQDRDLIISHLEEQPGLLTIVRQRHWEKAAKSTIVAAVRKHPAQLQSSWLEALVSLQDKSLYPDIAYAYMISWDKYNYLEILKKLPDFNLQSAVDQGWDYHRKRLRIQSWAQLDDYWMAMIAARYGHRDALDYLFKVLAAKSFIISSTPSALEAIQQAADVQGTEEQVADWYQKNGSQLSFDVTRQKFVVTPADVP